MKNVITIFITLLLIAGCNSTHSGSGKNASKVGSEVASIDVPFRSHGYSTFNSRVIDSEEGYDAFVLSLKPWKGKAALLEKLKEQAIDYKKYNLLLCRLTESSGSISLTVKSPVYDTENVLTISIERNVPDMGTTDMAYYLLAYQIDKNVTDVVFDDGKQKVIIENIASISTIPKNCLSWFDGCNTCGRLDGGEAVCTKMVCPNSMEEAYCKEWSK